MRGSLQDWLAMQGSYKTNKTETLKSIGIVLGLGLYWYSGFSLLYCIGIVVGGNSMYCSSVKSDDAKWAFLVDLFVVKNALL